LPDGRFSPTNHEVLRVHTYGYPVGVVLHNESPMTALRSAIVTVLCSFALLLTFDSSAFARDYFLKQFIELPNPTKTRVKAGCLKWVKPWKGAKICRAHKYETHMERKKVFFAASGPDSGEQAVRRAVEGIVTVCAAAAVEKALAAAAAASGGSPAAQMAAALPVLVGSFNACIATAAKSAAPVVGAIAKQVSIGFRTKSEMKRL
jgi:hypothetical protein